MSTTSMATPSFDVVETGSTFLINALFNALLYGIILVQFYVYLYNFPDDRRSLKSLACAVFLVATLETGLSWADTYYWFVDGFGNPEHLEDSHFSPIDTPMTGGLLCLMSQGYFCYRIWVLNRRPWCQWLCLAIGVASLTQVVAAFYLGIDGLIVGRFVVRKIAISLWSTMNALADVMIVAAMAMQLRRAQGKFTNIVLIRVARLTIETNAITATMAVTILVLYIAFPDKLYYVYPAGVFGKVYANTLLVSLNNRIYFRDHESSSNHLNNEGLAIRVNTISVTSPSDAVAGPQPQAWNANNIHPLSTTTSQQDHQDSVKSDHSSSLISQPQCTAV